MDKTKELGTRPIGSLIVQYSIPSVIAMIVNAVYNVVDRMFIGKFAGEEALAGLTIAFPVMMIIFAFAALVGAGGSSLLAIRLGEKEKRAASGVLGNSITLGILITAITLGVVFIKLQSLLHLFGATEGIVEIAADYMKIIMIGFIFQMLSMIFNNTVRAEGQPLLPMAAMLISAISNIILDYIFIAIFGMGVKGAALATIAGQFSGFLLLASFYLRGKSHLHLKLKDFIPAVAVVRKIFILGFSTFAGIVGTSVAMAFLNRGLGAYGGTAAITALGAINSLYTLFIMPLMGIQQGVLPIIGYNYGAKLMKRVYQALKIAIAAALVFSSVVFIFLQFSPGTFLSMFIDPSSATIGIAISGLRAFILMLPVLSINIIGVAFFQATDRGRISMVLSLLRQFLFLVPLVLILPQFFGLNGVWVATPIADGLAVLATLIMLILDYRKYGKPVPLYESGFRTGEETAEIALASEEVPQELEIIGV